MAESRTALIEKLDRELLRIGMPPQDARAYIELLTGGPQRVQQVDVITRRRLQRAGLIGERHGGRTLYAIDPALAWNSRTATFVWRLAPQLGSVDNLSETSDRRFEQVRKSYEQIVGLAQRLFVPQGGLPEHHPVSTKDADALAALTAEAILSGKREIRGVSRTPRLPHVALIWKAITNRIGAGLSYRRVADLPEIVDHGLAVVRRDMYGVGVQLRVAEADRIQHSWYLVDRTLLVIRDDNRDNGLAAGGTVTRHRSLITRYVHSFERLWERSVDGRLVVGALADQVPRMLAQAAPLGDEGVEWVRDLVRWGKFSNYPVRKAWPTARLKSLLADAEALGVVRLSTEGRPVPCYGSGEEVLQAIRQQASPQPEEFCPSCWERADDCLEGAEERPP